MDQSSRRGGVILGEAGAHGQRGAPVKVSLGLSCPRCVSFQDSSSSGFSLRLPWVLTRALLLSVSLVQAQLRAAITISRKPYTVQTRLLNVLL